MTFNHNICIQVGLYFGNVSEKVGIISSRNELERISIWQGTENVISNALSLTSG